MVHRARERIREQYRRLIRAGCCIVMLLVYAGIFWSVWISYYSPKMERVFWTRGQSMFFAYYVFWLFLCIKIYEGWKAGYHRIFSLIFSQAIGILIANLIIYVTIILLTKGVGDPFPLIGVALLQILVSIPGAWISTKIYRAAYPARRVIVIRGDRPVNLLLMKFHTRADRFVIGREMAISQGLDKIRAEIPKYQGVIIGDMPSMERNDLLKCCYGAGIRAYMVPKISDLLIRSAENQHMFDTPLLMARNTGLTIEQGALKRLMDIVLSLLLLILTAPVMLVTAICIRAEDGGSIIYSQTRLTLHGEEFQIHKFRSMREDAEADGTPRLAEDEDERVTKVGRVIRAFRIDELPQLFDVLRGAMSLVGPRPERPSIAAQYEAEIPEFRYRLKVKAGLTGYAQVYGKYNTTAYDKLKMDIIYIQNASLLMDLEIILMTIRILFEKEKTEGFRNGKSFDSGYSGI